MMGEADKLAWMVRESIRSALLNVHTAMPGIIQSFDRTKFLASVQPALKKSLPDGVLSLPVIPNVPVIMPRAAGAFVRMPVTAGDSCLLLFSESSIDNWLSLGGVQDPQDQRKFDLSDALCIVGLYDFAHPPPQDGGASTSVVLYNGGGYIEVTQAGKFKFVNGAVEVLAQVSSALSSISSAMGALSSGKVNASGTGAALKDSNNGLCTGTAPLDTGTTGAASSAQSACQTAQTNIDRVRG